MIVTHAAKKPRRSRPNVLVTVIELTFLCAGISFAYNSMWAIAVIFFIASILTYVVYILFKNRTPRNPRSRNSDLPTG